MMYGKLIRSSSPPPLSGQARKERVHYIIPRVPPTLAS